MYILLLVCVLHWASPVFPLPHAFTSSATQGRRLTSKEGARSPGPTGGVSVGVDVTDTSGEGDSSGCGACVHMETDFKFNFTIEQ